MFSKHKKENFKKDQQAIEIKLALIYILLIVLFVTVIVFL